MFNRILILVLVGFVFGDTVGQSVNKTWVARFNENSTKLSELYTEDPVLITGVGRIYDGRNDFMAYVDDLKMSFSSISNIETIKKIDIGDNMSYEIGKFTANNKYYRYLIIWNEKDKKSKRELEVIIPKSDKSAVLSEIDEARERWIALCNANNAYELVSLLYTKNAIYYNHKPVIRGTEAIAEEYSYMNRPQYSLNLTPIHVENVDESNVFEIGQCSGTYGGKYMLWWTKNDQGEWQVLMDSNK